MSVAQHLLATGHGIVGFPLLPSFPLDPPTSLDHCVPGCTTGYMLVFGKCPNPCFTLRIFQPPQNKTKCVFSFIGLHHAKLVQEYDLDFFSLLMCVCVCEHVQVPAEARRGCWILWNRIMGVGERPDVGAGMQAHPLKKE